MWDSGSCTALQSMGLEVLRFDPVSDYKHGFILVRIWPYLPWHFGIVLAHLRLILFASYIYGLLCFTNARSCMLRLGLSAEPSR